MTAIEFLRNKGIISPTQTKWYLMWPNGNRIELIDIIEEYASQFRPGPYSLDPKAENYKVPEVGELVDILREDGTVTKTYWYNSILTSENRVIAWLPSRTKDDFGR